MCRQKYVWQLRREFYAKLNEKDRSRYDTQSFLYIFWNFSGVLHYELLENGQALTSEVNRRHARLISLDTHLNDPH